MVKMIEFIIELTLGLFIVLPITMFVIDVIFAAIFPFSVETEGCRVAREELEHERYRQEEAAASEKRKAAWLTKYPNYAIKKVVKSTTASSKKPISPAVIPGYSL